MKKSLLRHALVLCALVGMGVGCSPAGRRWRGAYYKERLGGAVPVEVTIGNSRFNPEFLLDWARAA